VSAAAIVLWGLLSLLLGWVGLVLWSTYTWLRDGLEELDRKRPY
jgi:hypothetical protein